MRDIKRLIPEAELKQIQEILLEKTVPNADTWDKIHRLISGKRMVESHLNLAVRGTYYRGSKPSTFFFPEIGELKVVGAGSIMFEPKERWDKYWAGLLVRGNADVLFEVVPFFQGLAIGRTTINRCYPRDTTRFGEFGHQTCPTFLRLASGGHEEADEYGIPCGYWGQLRAWLDIYLPVR